jgi:putative tryptophan/tyrosine transport system substrate-binding protein
MMKRRELITLLGGAAAVWPLAAIAQHPQMPVVGFLNGTSPDVLTSFLHAFHQGLGETGYIEGRNVVIEYRWAESQYSRLTELAADLVRRQVTVIVATPNASALAAKAATTTIPIVFLTASDPVNLGLVSSLSRPDGNLTGVTNLNVEVGPKRLELLHELVPTIQVAGLLVNPANPTIADSHSREMEATATALGLRLHIVRASNENDLESVFKTLVQRQANGLVRAPDLFFLARSEQLAALALRYRVPTIFQFREFSVAGGLTSYGGSSRELFRQIGIYTGRILKGEKPADLPVQQSTKVELIINLKTAKALGLEIPPTLLARADEVIE